MRLRGVFPACVLSSGLIMVLAGCSHETGPELSAAVDQEFLAPTLEAPDAAQRCCCRVRGAIRNTSSIEVHVSLRWRITDLEGKDVGTAIDFVPNIKPGDSRAFDGAGIYIPCANVKTYERDVLVIGLYHDDTGGQ
jgi:hypothetical protein